MIYFYFDCCIPTYNVLYERCWIYKLDFLFSLTRTNNFYLLILRMGMDEDDVKLN